LDPRAHNGYRAGADSFRTDLAPFTPCPKQAANRARPVTGVTRRCRCAHRAAWRRTAPRDASHAVKLAAWVDNTGRGFPAAANSHWRPSQFERRHVFRTHRLGVGRRRRYRAGPSPQCLGKTLKLKPSAHGPQGTLGCGRPA
jgi:hypothetical protein